MLLFPVYVSLLTTFISSDALLCRQLKNIKGLCPADERIHVPTPARVYTHTYIHTQESASIHDASDQSRLFIFSYTRASKSWRIRGEIMAGTGHAHPSTPSGDANWFACTCVCYMRLCVRGYLCPAGAHSATPKAFNPHRGLRQQHHCQWGSGILEHMRGGMLRVCVCVSVCYRVVAQDSWNMYCCHANSRMIEYMFGRMSLCVCVWDWTDFCRHVCQRSSLFSCISDYAYYLLCLLPLPTGTYTHAHTHTFIQRHT